MKKRSKNTKKVILIFSLIAIVALFVLYSFWLPSSQVFWKTMHLANNGKILLTFDDGPGAETPQIIQTLNKNNVTAIFFVVCDHVSPNEESLLKNMSTNGNIIGLHAKTHIANENYSDLLECKTYLENITGKQVQYFRPPYGFKAPRTMSAAKNLNMTIVLWSNFPRDYNAKSSDQIIKRVERNLKSGDIIAMHDGPENRQKTADALQNIISYAKDKNYTFENRN